MKNLFSTTKDRHCNEMAVVKMPDGKAMFNACDAAALLGYKNPLEATIKVCQNCAAIGVNIDKRTKHSIEEILFIPASDVFRLAIFSDNPDAEDFMNWFATRALPAVFHNSDEKKDSCEGIEEIVSESKEADCRQCAEESDNMAKIMTEINSLKARVDQFESKEGFIKQDVNNCLLTTSDIAKELYMSARELNKILENLGIQRRVKGGWVPEKEFADNKLSKTMLMPPGIGRPWTCWTEDGKQAILRELVRNGIVSPIECLSGALAFDL